MLLPLFSSRFWRSGFSLVELLVSIAVLGILASLLVTVMGKARSHMETTECASNLRQMGVAINLYANEHNGNFPGPAFVSVFHDLSYRNPSFPQHTLTYYLAPYLEIDISSDEPERNHVCDVAICPAFESNYGPPEGVVAGEAHYQRHRTERYSPFGGKTGDSYMPPMSIATIDERLGRRHSEAIAVYDMDESKDYGPGAPIHNGGRNYLYLDGRVEWHEGAALPGDYAEE